MKKSIVIWSMMLERFWVGDLHSPFLWTRDIQDAKQFEDESFALLEMDKVVCNPKLGVAGKYYELKTIYSKES